MNNTIYSIIRKSATIKIYRIQVVFAGLMLITLQSAGQQNPLFSQYMFNGLVINPAYTGSQESMVLTAGSRSQWTGLNGAPWTQVATIHSPIKLSRSAAGGVFVHDHVGVTNQYTVYGTYAYGIPVSENAKIAVGAQAGVTYYKSNLSDLLIITPNGQSDPHLPKLKAGICRTWVLVSTTIPKGAMLAYPYRR